MSIFYAELIPVIEGSYQRIVTSYGILPEQYGLVEVEHSQLPDGMALEFQGIQLILFGTPAIGTVGDWPVSIQLWNIDGTRIGRQAPFKIQIQSKEDQAFADNSDLGLSLGDFYYQLCGGPLRQEMRDGV